MSHSLWVTNLGTANNPSFMVEHLFAQPMILEGD